MTIKEVFKQTKTLPPFEKAKLVDLILSDLDKPDLVIEKAWIKEVIQRKNNVRTGKSKLLSYQQVMGKYK